MRSKHRISKNDGKTSPRPQSEKPAPESSVKTTEDEKLTPHNRKALQVILDFEGMELAAYSEKALRWLMSVSRDDMMDLALDKSRCAPVNHRAAKSLQRLNAALAKPGAPVPAPGSSSPCRHFRAGQITELLEGPNGLEMLISEVRALLYIYSKQLSSAIDEAGDYVSKAIQMGLDCRVWSLDEELERVVERISAAAGALPQTAAAHSSPVELTAQKEAA